MASYSVTVDNRNELISIVCEGLVDKHIASAMVGEARAKSAEKGYGLLYDLRKATFKGSILDMYQLPRDPNIFKESREKGRKSANVFAVDADREVLDFYETTALNTGLNWKAFFSIDEALKWLKE